MLTTIAIVVTSYLLGSIPFGLILVRIFRKEDIRTLGSGNIGATNVVRSGAKGLGAATFLLDALKGYVAVYIAGMLMHGSAHGIPALQNASALAGIVVVLGHMFPVWLGFNGGKGVATALGMAIALSPLAALIALGVFIAVLAISRYVSLASILAVTVYPIFALLVFRLPRTALSAAVIIGVPLLVVIRHHKNIARLAQGTEYRFGKTNTA
jgi:glycerol-3-phosphate acyltransferase PlsY